MISLEQFRERLRPPPRATNRSADWSKWISLPVSWLALLISGASFYLNSVRQVDDLKVTIDSETFLTATFDGPSTGFELISPTQKITFINSGNRQATVSEVRLAFTLDGDCVRADSGSISSFSYKFSNLVVKPGEMIPVSLTEINGHQFYDTKITPRGVTLTGNAVWFLSMQFSGRKDLAATLCLTFRYLTPSSATRETRVLLWAGLVRKDAASFNRGQIVRDSPAVLVQEGGTSSFSLPFSR